MNIPPAAEIRTICEHLGIHAGEPLTREQIKVITQHKSQGIQQTPPTIRTCACGQPGIAMVNNCGVCARCLEIEERMTHENHRRNQKRRPYVGGLDLYHCYFNPNKPNQLSIQ